MHTPMLACRQIGNGVVETAPCPICDRVHRHGLSPSLRAGEPSHRMGHCSRSKLPAWIRKQRSPWLAELYQKARRNGYFLLIDQPTT